MKTTLWLMLLTLGLWAHLSEGAIRTYANLITINGKAYENVSVIRVEGDCIYVRHKSGGGRIEADQLPESILKDLGLPSHEEMARTQEVQRRQMAEELAAFRERQATERSKAQHITYVSVATNADGQAQRRLTVDRLITTSNVISVSRSHPATSTKASRKQNAVTERRHPGNRDPEDTHVVAIIAIVLAVVAIAGIVIRSKTRGGLVVHSGPATCPRCGSPTIMGAKEGYDVSSGFCGAMLLGPLGLLCGALDSNRINVHCLNCGHRWTLR